MRLRPLLLVLICFASARAETRRTAAVLSTTDSSGYGISERLQRMLADGLNRTQLFAVSTQNITLAGYTPESLAPAFSQSRAELLSFAYVDKDRIALFLFDANRPAKYVATSETLAGSPTGRMTEPWLEARFNRALSTLLRNYASAAFEAVPGIEESEKPAEPEMSREERGQRLFQELSKLQDRQMYVGANIGMARFSARGATASTVSLGGYLGVKLVERLRLEAGADVFSYLMLHGDMRYQLPLGERYVSLSIGIGLNHITSVVTQNRGFNPTFLRTGQLLYGPSLSFDVPLLGASVRGDIRVLFGEATILMGTYGLAYAL